MDMSHALIGETRIFPYNYAPAGWAPCNGQLLPITGNELLYYVIWTDYGGDGQTNFAVPKLVGPKSHGTPLQVCIALSGVSPRAA